MKTLAETAAEIEKLNAATLAALATLDPLHTAHIGAWALFHTVWAAPKKAR